MGRSYCPVCNRPEKVCLCPYIAMQDNKLPVLLLQHEDEANKPLSTAPLIKAGLSKVLLQTGLVFDQRACLKSLLAMGARNPALLYPTPLGQAEHRVLDMNLDSDVNAANLNMYDAVIVLDGTWRNTKELVFQNTWLTGLPTLGLSNVAESRYRIRKSTQEASLSTIEAVAQLMAIDDPSFDTTRFLRPFERMIDVQIACMGEEVFKRNYC